MPGFVVAGYPGVLGVSFDVTAAFTNQVTPLWANNRGYDGCF
jgi:hypothetical protein